MQLDSTLNTSEILTTNRHPNRQLPLTTGSTPPVTYVTSTKIASAKPSRASRAGTDRSTTVHNRPTDLGLKVARPLSLSSSRKLWGPAGEDFSDVYRPKPSLSTSASAADFASVASPSALRSPSHRRGEDVDGDGGEEYEYVEVPGDGLEGGDMSAGDNSSSAAASTAAARPQSVQRSMSGSRSTSVLPRPSTTAGLSSSSSSASRWGLPRNLTALDADDVDTLALEVAGVLQRVEGPVPGLTRTRSSGAITGVTRGAAVDTIYRLPSGSTVGSAAARATTSTAAAAAAAASAAAGSTVGSTLAALSAASGYPTAVVQPVIVTKKVCESNVATVVGCWPRLCRC